MAIRIPTFGDSSVDKVVVAWLMNNGISPNKVRSYSVDKSPRDSTITLTMHFDDVPAHEALADEKEE